MAYAPGNDPSGSLLEGLLNLATNGILEMEIAGEILGLEHDHLTVTGAATLDGTLNIVFVDGYIPTNEVSFQLFKWNGGTTGTFGTVNPVLDHPAFLRTDSSQNVK